MKDNEFQKEMLFSTNEYFEEILILRQIHKEIKNKDNWASLSTTGKILKERKPDLKNTKSLKVLLLKTNMFEIKEELSHIFYKPIENTTFQIS